MKVLDIPITLDENVPVIANEYNHDWEQDSENLVGSMWDSGQQQLVFTRPSGYENYELMLLFYSKSRDGRTKLLEQNIGTASTYTLSNAMTQREFLGVQVAFLDTDYRGGSNILWFRYRYSAQDGAVPAEIENQYVTLFKKVIVNGETDDDNVLTFINNDGETVFSVQIPNATLEIGDIATETLAAGENATVDLTYQDGVLSGAFRIPQGKQGIQGIQGERGRDGDGVYFYVLRIAFDASLVGETYSVVGGAFSDTGTVPSGLVAEVYATVPNTVYTVECGDYAGTVETTQYFGFYDVELKAASTIPANFADATWQEISYASQNNLIPDTWQVGDEKDETLSTGETLTFQIYDFNHDPLADGSGNAGITLGMKNLMADTRAMNSTNTNVGSFTGSELYAWLTGDLWNSLPSDLQAVIRPVTKYTSEGNKSTTILTETMSIFLFSEVELFGSVTYSAAGEGSQYPIFTDNVSRIKYLSNGKGAAKTWCQRSPAASTNSGIYCVVYENGGATYLTNIVAYGFGINFGFCI